MEDIIARKYTKERKKFDKNWEEERHTKTSGKNSIKDAKYNKRYKEVSWRKSQDIWKKKIVKRDGKREFLLDWDMRI